MPEAAYASVTAKIAEALANPQPSYTEKGRSISWDAYYEMLLKSEERLRKIPGVAPSTVPVFTIVSVGK
jgi:hypothetical protein